MNRVKDWRGNLKAANKEAGRYGYNIRIKYKNDGSFNCEIWKDGKRRETYAINYYEDELSGLVDDALAYVINTLVPQDQQRSRIVENVPVAKSPEKDDCDKTVDEIREDLTGKYGFNLDKMAAAYGCSLEVLARVLLCGGSVLKKTGEASPKDGGTEGKKKYRVTLYYHTNVTVSVEARDRDEAVNAAYAKVGGDEYTKMILEGLQEDDSPDVEEEETE